MNGHMLQAGACIEVEKTLCYRLIMVEIEALQKKRGVIPSNSIEMFERGVLHAPISPSVRIGSQVK